MGTRYLTCVVLDGEYKVAQYGAWDGYPEGAGKDILRFLQETDVSIFKNEVSKLRFATEEEIEKFEKDLETYTYGMTKEQYKSQRSEDLERRERPTREILDKFYSRPLLQFNRELGHDILGLILRGRTTILRNSINFAGFSLHCEWVYVIDLDGNRFEVYRGLNEEPVPEGERFANFEGEQPGDFEWRDRYYPVKHLATFKQDKLPSEEDFLERCPDSL